MKHGKTMIAAIVGAAALHIGGAGAMAAPMAGFGTSVVVDGAALEQVHWRPYRHCHWRWGRRYCHGAYHRPGVRLFYGPRHHRHHRDHHRRWHRR